MTGRVMVVAMGLILMLSVAAYATHHDGGGGALAPDSGRNMTLAFQALTAFAVLAAVLGVGGVLRRRARQ